VAQTRVLLELSVLGILIRRPIAIQDTIRLLINLKSVFHVLLEHFAVQSEQKRLRNVTMDSIVNITKMLEHKAVYHVPLAFTWIQMISGNLILLITIWVPTQNHNVGHVLEDIIALQMALKQLHKTP